MNADQTLLGPSPPPSGRARTTHPVNATMGSSIAAASIAAVLLIVAGCAGAPAPTQLMADVQSANRTANELGAQNSPQAKLHLKLAEEQFEQAKVALEADDIERAEALLMRAKADAELAVALTREDANNTTRPTRPGAKP